MRHLLAAFLLLTSVSALAYDGFCFDLVYPDVVQVARGNSTTFEVHILNTGPYTQLKDVYMEFDGQCSVANYPCVYEFRQPGDVLWNRTVEVTLNMPQALYDDPVKNVLYSEDGRYIGYRREFIKVNSSECNFERTDLLIKPLYGDELKAVLDPVEEQEVFQDDEILYKVSLENVGPEPFNITVDEEGVSHRRVTFEPPFLTLPPESKANVFIRIDTTDMELGSKKARIILKTGALEDIRLLARFKVKAAGALAQRQFELYEEIDDLDDSFEAKIKEATYNVTDIIQVRAHLANTRDLITNGYLGIAQEEIPRLEAEIERMKPIAIPEPEIESEEVVIVEQIPDESRFREAEFSAESFEVFMRQYAWLMLLILMGFGTAIGYVAYKGFFVPNTKMIKDVRYVSDIEAKVSLKIRNNSMRSLKNVVLIEHIPQGFKLQSRFTAKGKNIPFTREETYEGVSFRMDLSVIDANSSLEIEYVLEKPKVIFGKVEIAPSTLNYTFRKKAVTLNSNTPTLGV